MRAAVRVAWSLTALHLAACSGEEPVVARPPEGFEVGQSAPPLQGRLADGEAFDLASHGGRPVVLVFYRAASCGLCRVQLERLDGHLGEYRTLGAEAFAVTLEPPEASAELARSDGLEVPLVSVDSAAFRRWGLLEEGRTSPLPGTFLVDESGVLLFRYVGRNAADRATDAGVLAVLERRAVEP